ncbi:hypothetical protein EV426DRAFT_578385 [Tirmania nivea]|nr:hypothetical protein EV426DRAFT_578385 [Tirmania nivea]
MQIKSSLPSILLLTLPGMVFAAPEDAVPVRYVKASVLGISKRNPFALNVEPQYMAMPLSMNSLVRRQSSCGLGATECYDGCCDIGTVCGIYGGEKGCCPLGKNCNRVSGCQNSDDVPCKDFCCPSGTTCATDSNGDPTCSEGTDNTGSQCDAGYSACTLFEGCCPTGSECVLPKNCNILCDSDDSVCGDGCCQKGEYCNSDGTCAKGSSPTVRTTTKFTMVPTNTEEPTTYFPTATPIDSPSTDSSSVTDDFLNGSDSTSTSTTTTVTTTASRRTIETITANAAPTMGAMLGGGLGMAAGVLGALAM